MRRINIENQNNFSFKDEILRVINEQSDPHINISYSLLDKFEVCPRSVFYQLVVPYGVAPQNAAPFIGGSVVHKLVETWAKATNFQSGWLEENYLKFFENYERSCSILDYSTEQLGKEAINEWGVNSPREYQIEKVRRSLAPISKFVEDKNLKSHDVQFERWITVKTKETIFRLKGSIDIWDNTTKSIYDIKITSNTSYGNLLQLQFYSALVYFSDKVIPSKAEFVLPLGSKVSYQSFKPSMDDVRAALGKVKHFIDSFYNNEFPLTSTGAGCYYCNFKNVCPKYGGVYERQDEGLGEYDIFGG